MNIWVGYTIVVIGGFGIPIWRLAKHSREAEERAAATERIASDSIREKRKQEAYDEENRRFVLTVSGSQVEDWSYGELNRLISDGWMEQWTSIIDADEIWVES